MNREQLIEALTRAHYANYFEGLENLEPAFSEQPESHQDRMREAMSAALTAIEAQGLAVVPVEATDAQILASLESSMKIMNREGVTELMPDDLTVSPSMVSRSAYRAMIEAGKL